MMKIASGVVFFLCECYVVEEIAKKKWWILIVGVDLLIIIV